MGVLRKWGSPHHWMLQLGAEVLVDAPSTHILRNQHSSIGMFHTLGSVLLAAQGEASWPMKRKEIADINYHFAILNILALIWPILTLMDVLNREGIKFTTVSSKCSEKYFLGFEEETWPHKELHGERASPRCFSPHTLKADHHLPLTIQHALQQETARPSALVSAPLTLLNLWLPKYPYERVSQEAASKGRKSLWNW